MGHCAHVRRCATEGSVRVNERLLFLADSRYTKLDVRRPLDDQHAVSSLTENIVARYLQSFERLLHGVQ